MRRMLAVMLVAGLAGCVREGDPAVPVATVQPGPDADTFSVLNGGFVENTWFGGADMVDADRAARDYCASRGKVPELLGRPPVSGTRLRAATYVCRVPAGAKAATPFVVEAPPGPISPSRPPLGAYPGYDPKDLRK